MTCTPRYGTPRSPERETRGPEVTAAALSFGVDLMDWQNQFLDVAMEVDEDGQFVYRELVLLTPRQSGKTILAAALIIHRALMFGRNTLTAYSCQTGNDARTKMFDDLLPVLSATGSVSASTIKKVNRGSGQESIAFTTGSRVHLIAGTEMAGHGRTHDFAVMDEAAADSDTRREESLAPSMITVADAQTFICSNAGTEASAAFDAQARQRPRRGG